MRPLYRLLPLGALLILAACDTNDPDGTRLRANDDAATTAPGQPVVIDVLANDQGDGLRITAFDTTTVRGGTIVEASEGQLRYTPQNDFTGTDTFSYTVTDARGATDQATVTVTVTGTGGNRPPVARDNAAQTVAGQAVTIDVLANDTDPDGDALSIASFQATTANGGTVTETDDDQLRYTPADGFTGADTFTYVAADEHGLTSNTATVTVTVQPAPNSPPVANDDAAQVSAGQAVNIDLFANDFDPDGDALTLAAIGNPSGGSFLGVNIATGVVRYLAPPTPGTYTFGYTVTDGQATDTATVTVTVK